LCLATFVVAITVATSSLQAQISITSVGKYDISGVPAEQEGLSGLTYAGGNQYYAAEDSGGRLHSLTINVNLADGTITGTPTDNSQAILLGRDDMEAVAYAGANQVYVTDETGPIIAKYNVSGGNSLTTLAVPDVFTAYRTNKSLESLTIQAGGLAMWTAHEEALSGTTTLGTTIDDGGISSGTYGTIVRLQKFDSNLNPAGQWAYQVDPHAGIPAAGTPASGVSDLCALPDGTLLVLEREIGGYFPSFRNRIYKVDFTNATDVSGDHTLYDLPTSEMVSKTLLWEDNFGLDNNFEGLCLGPKLANGDYSLLMISDGDQADPINPGESIYALRLSGLVPEPTTISLLLLGGLALLKHR
jgi:hypothetical protein